MNAHTVGNFDKGQTITTVSRQWISRSADEKFLTLEDLRASVDARRQRSVETVADTRRIEFLAPEPKVKEDIHSLTIGLPTGDELAPSHWSFGQLCSLGKAPAGHYRELPSQIVADALTYRLRYNREADSVKLYASGPELLAATGPDYGRIFDADVVDAVINFTGETGRWKVPGVLNWRNSTYDPDHPVTKDTTTLFASDRDVFMFLVDDRNPIEVGKLRNGEPDLMFRGFYISNSEVGAGSLRLAAFYLRAVCCNRILWGVEGFQELAMRHSKYAPTRFVEEARPALKSFADGSERRLMDGVEKAKAAKVARNEDDALDFLTQRNFSRKRALEVIEAVEREEGGKPETIWDFAQGITAVARNVPNNDARIELEGEARKLLDKVAA